MFPKSTGIRLYPDICPLINKYLLTSRPRGGETQCLLDVLPDRHGTEYVEKDEAAVGHVVTEEVSVAETLDPVDWGEGKLGDDPTVKDRVEHGQESREGESDGKHRLHLDHRQVAVGVLQLLLILS